MLKYKVWLNETPIEVSVDSPGVESVGELQYSGDGDGSFRKWLSRQFDPFGHRMNTQAAAPMDLHYAITTGDLVFREIENTYEMKYFAAIPENSVS